MKRGTRRRPPRDRTHAQDTRNGTRSNARTYARTTRDQTTRTRRSPSGNRLDPGAHPEASRDRGGRGGVRTASGRPSCFAPLTYPDTSSGQEWDTFLWVRGRLNVRTGISCPSRRCNRRRAAWLPGCRAAAATGRRSHASGVIGRSVTERQGIEATGPGRTRSRRGGSPTGTTRTTRAAGTRGERRFWFLGMTRDSNERLQRAPLC